MNSNFYCVIMAGGTGTRLWPISKVSRPKQFLEIEGRNRTFLQATFDRFVKIVPRDNILVVTAERFKNLVSEQLPDIKPENVLLEPYSRDTAPCIAYATYTLLKRNPSAVVAVTPSDHVIPDESVFVEDVTKAMDYAEGKDALVTLGVIPTRPDPNYGYIQVSGGRYKKGEDKAVKVKTFTEKPDVELAKVFVNSGEFFWNSGIFVWKAQTVREELEKYLPEVTRLFAGWERVLGSPVERTFIEKAYTDCIRISIDYGIMEKTERAWLYPSHFRWADIGNWESLYDFFPKKDAKGNTSNSPHLLLKETEGCMVITKDKGKLLAVNGLKDYIIIDTEDVLLICPKDDKKVKDFTGGIAMPGFEKYR